MCISQGLLELQCMGIAKCGSCSLLNLLCLRCCDVWGLQFVEIIFDPLGLTLTMSL